MQKEFENKLEIYDEENNLLALKLCINSQQNPKEFHTSDEQSFQVGTFNLTSGEKLERHVHLHNERLVTTTSEVIIVNKGELLKHPLLRLYFYRYKIFEFLLHQLIIHKYELIRLL